MQIPTFTISSRVSVCRYDFRHRHALKMDLVRIRADPILLPFLTLFRKFIAMTMTSTTDGASLKDQITVWEI